MPVSISASERAIIERRQEAFAGGTDFLSPAERQTVLAIARQIQEGKNVWAGDPVLFQNVESMKRTARRELIALGKQAAQSIETILTHPGQPTLAQAAEAGERLTEFDSGGPADSSGFVIRVPIEKDLITGKTRRTYVSVHAGWSDNLQAIRDKAQEIVDRFDKSPDRPWRIMI